MPSTKSAGHAQKMSDAEFIETFYEKVMLGANDWLVSSSHSAHFDHCEAPVCRAAKLLKASQGK